MSALPLQNAELPEKERSCGTAQTRLSPRSALSPPPSNTSLAPAVFPLLTVAHVPLHTYPSGNFLTMQISPKPRALPCKALKINVNLFLVFCLQWIHKSQWQSFY